MCGAEKRVEIDVDIVQVLQCSIVDQIRQNLQLQALLTFSFGQK